VYPTEPERQRPRLVVYYTLTDTPVVQKLGFSPSQVQIPFNGTAGKTYTILRAPTVSGPWAPVGTATVGVDGSGVYMDSSPLAGQGFYRVSYP
jgi:hypothetical protein